MSSCLMVTEQGLLRPLEPIVIGETGEEEPKVGSCYHGLYT